MIVGLVGVVTKKNDKDIYINVNGIVYQVFVSKNTITSLEVNADISLDIIHIIKEESQTLYGFLDKNEKNIFTKVIKVNGVGPKIALEICSSFSPQNFYSMIESRDMKLLQKVPGIGAKGAGKILIELNGFTLDILENNYSDKPFYSDALGALVNLGFNRHDISVALNECTDAKNTQSLIKEALKKLGKK